MTTFDTSSVQMAAAAGGMNEKAAARRRVAKEDTHTAIRLAHFRF